MDATRENVEALSYRELQALAKSLNLKASGKREELLERLLVRLFLGTLIFVFCISHVEQTWIHR